MVLNTVNGELVNRRKIHQQLVWYCLLQDEQLRNDRRMRHFRDLKIIRQSIFPLEHCACCCFGQFLEWFGGDRCVSVSECLDQSRTQRNEQASYKARAMGSTVSNNAILCSQIASTRFGMGLAWLYPSLGISAVRGKGDHCVCEDGDAGRGRETFSSEASSVNGLPNEKLDRLGGISTAQSQVVAELTSSRRKMPKRPWPGYATPRPSSRPVRRKNRY